jgi:hypothetical protein
MKMFVLLSIIFLLAAGFVSADAANCVEFRGCIDGSDWIHVDDGHLTLTHNNYSPIGSPSNCPADYYNVAYIDNNPISLYYENNQYMHADSFFDVFVSLDDISAFTQNGGRGSVTQDGNSLYINDDGYGGGDVYTINICGTPHQDEVPEFGLIGAGIILLAGIGIIVYKRK